MSKKTKYLECRVDKFHFFGFISSCLLFVVFIVLTIIDFSLNLSITQYLGEITLSFCLVGVLLLPVIYEAFLIAWWTTLDKDNPKVKKICKFNKIKKRGQKDDVQASCHSDSSENGTDAE